MSNLSKSSLLVIIALTIFLAGCNDTTKSSSNFPPEPPSVGKAAAIITNIAGMAFETPDGYAPPYDIFNNKKEIFSINPTTFKLYLDDNSLTLNAKAYQPGGYIYKTGYYFSKNYGWKTYEFDQATVGNSNWIKESADVKLNLDINEFEVGENYIVAYSCKSYQGEWKCGCKTTNGPCGLWMLQKFTVNQYDLPPEPPKPGEIPSISGFISAGNGIYRSDNEDGVRIYGNLRANFDFSSDLKNANLIITTPENLIEKVSISGSQLSQMNCHECIGVNCPYTYNCDAFFESTYYPNVQGEYLLDLEITRKGGITLNNFIVGDYYFNDNLIEEDIGGFKFQSSRGTLNNGVASVYAYYFSIDPNEDYLRNYADIQVLLDKDIEYFTKEALRRDYSQISYDGSIVYLLKRESSNYNSLEYIWSSNNKFVKLDINGKGNLNSEIMLSKYLEKLPSDNIIAEPMHYPDILIESDIGNYNYIKSYSEDMGIENSKMFIADYQSTETPNINVKANVAVFYEGITEEVYHDVFDSRNKIITIDGNDLYESHGSILWISNDNVVIIEEPQRQMIEVEVISNDPLKEAIVGDNGESVDSESPEVIPDNSNYPKEIILAYLQKYPVTVKQTCQDSDGVNYYSKGESTLCRNLLNGQAGNGDCKTTADYCTQSGSEVVENICQGPSMVQAVIKCDNGCDSGACKINGFEDYPDFLFSDGNLNAILVVGDNAPAEDVIAVSDISTSLSYYNGESSKPIPVGITMLASEVKDPKAQNMILVGRPTIYTGDQSNKLIDSFKLPVLSNGVSLLKIADNGNYFAVIVTAKDKEGIGKAAKVLSNWKDNTELLKGMEVVLETPNPVLEDSFSIPIKLNQRISDSILTITQYQWPALTGSGDFDYLQNVSNISGILVYDEDDNDYLDHYLHFYDGDIAFQYNLHFNKAMSSMMNTRNNHLLEIENKKLNILGKDYTIVSATYDIGNHILRLEMMETVVFDSLEEGSTRTYSLGNLDYEVTTILINDSGNKSVKFTINGERTSLLREGQSETLNDGSIISVKNIISKNGKSVEIYFGNGKLLFETSNSGGFVEIAGERIEDANFKIDYKLKEVVPGLIVINNIFYSLTIDGAKGAEPYIQLGNSLRDYLDEPEGMLGSWDIVFHDYNPGKNEGLVLLTVN